MEKESTPRIISDDEFMKLVKLAQTQSDVEAMNAIFQYFDQDIKRLSKLLRMPKEDAIQSMKTQLLELIMKK
ncbi:helix-turn-helix domain-containing protein [Paenibacillus brasilensis]|uniref:helix-turn-helix domain-containing protein n=1 Tax=Paenibacillus brasilensis TaxID=128574 RepID=UPI001FCC427D|nr:helix-turn-helix domain-containing protein [Paenibacillus brasilensis]